MSQEQVSSEKVGDQKGAGTPKERRRRRWSRFVLGVLVSVCAAVPALTRGPLATWIVSSAVNSTTGCTLTATWTAIGTDGKLVVTDPVFRVPDIEGPGGELLRAQSIEIDLDFSRWWLGDIRATTVRLNAPAIRLSQNEVGEINFSRLHPRMSKKKSFEGLPAFTVDHGTIEVGEHEGGKFQSLTRVGVHGAVGPTPGSTDEYTVLFQEETEDQQTVVDGMTLTGKFNLVSGEGAVELSRVELEQWTPQRVPKGLRSRWTQLAMSGRVASTRFEYRHDGTIESRIDLKDVSLNIPVPSGEEGVPERQMRMSGVAGFIKIRQGGSEEASRPGVRGGLNASLRGVIEDLACTVNISTDGLDPDASAVAVEVISEGFEMSQSPRLLPFAPQVIKKRLLSLSGPTAIVDARVVVQRAGRSTDPAGDAVIPGWSVSGAVQFKNGRAAFDQFPYPFFGLEGRVSFDDDKVEIKSITGRGLTGAKVRVEGSIRPPNDASNAEIRVDVFDVPMDELLAAALDKRNMLVTELLAAATEEKIEAVRAARWTDSFGAGSREASAAVPIPNIFEYVLGEARSQELFRSERSWRRGLYDSLFCEAKYDRLREQGLILDPTQKERLERELASLGAESTPELGAARADLERRLGAPEFVFGGQLKSIMVDVRLTPQTKHHFDTYIAIDFGKAGAGMVPKAFPLPIIARKMDVKVFQDAVIIEGREFTGLTGGTATVLGSIDISDPERTADVPHLTINAESFAVDERLFNAIPRRLTNATDESGEGFSAGDVLRALRPIGVANCTAEIIPGEKGRAGFKVGIDLDGLMASPVTRDPLTRPILLTQVRGRIDVSDRHLEIRRMEACLHSMTDAGAAEALDQAFVGPPAIDIELEGGMGGARRTGLLNLEVASDFAIGADGMPVSESIDANIIGRGIDLNMGIEDLVAAVAPPVAERLVTLRSERHPSGMVDCRVRVRSERENSGLGVDVTLERSKELAMDALGGRLSVEHRSGTIGMHIDPSVQPGAAGDDDHGVRVSLEEVDAGVKLNGEQVGEFKVDGGLRFTLPSPGGEIGGRGTGTKMSLVGPMALAITGAHVESPVIRKAIGTIGSAQLEEQIQKFDIAAVVDAQLRIVPGDAASHGQPLVSGVVVPRSFGVTRLGVRTDLTDLTGRVTIEDGRGKIESVRAKTDRWNLGIDGSFAIGTKEAPDGWSFDTELSANGSGLDRSLFALLPEAVGEAIDGAEVHIREGFDVERAHLVLSGDLPSGRSPGLRRADLTGQVVFAGLNANTGVLLTDGIGTMAFNVHKTESEPWAKVRLDLNIERFYAIGILVEHAVGTIVSGETPGEAEPDVVVPGIFGDCYGGRLSVQGVARSHAGTTARTFQARVQLSGVRFGEVLADLERRAEAAKQAAAGAATEAGGGKDGGTSAPATEAAKGAPGASRGLLDADLSVEGTVGDANSRRGRGSLRIAGGAVLQLPLMVPLMQLSNFQLPTGEKLDFAQSSYFIRGNRLVFDELAVLSPSLSIIGRGEMRLPDLTLDLRFTSQSRVRLALLSDLVEGVRNELVTTRVTGTLENPEIGTETLGGTMRLVKSIFSPPESEPTFSATEAENRARLERDRTRPLQ